MHWYRIWKSLQNMCEVDIVSTWHVKWKHRVETISTSHIFWHLTNLSPMTVASSMAEAACTFTYQTSFISNHKIIGHWMMHISLQKWNNEIWVIRTMWFILGSYHDGSLACSEFKSPTPEEQLKLRQNHRRQSMLHNSLSIHSTGLLSW